jgi:hypothetical protein
LALRRSGALSPGAPSDPPALTSLRPVNQLPRRERNIVQRARGDVLILWAASCELRHLGTLPRQDRASFALTPRAALLTRQVCRPAESEEEELSRDAWGCNTDRAEQDEYRLVKDVLTKHRTQRVNR